MNKPLSVFLLSFLTSVSLISHAGGKLCNFKKEAICSGFLEGINVSASGEIWLLDVPGGRVLSIDKGQCVERAKTGGMPNGAKFLPNGKMVIADHNGLLEYDPETQQFEVLVDSFNEQPLTSLNDLSIDSQGGIYFTDMGPSSIQKPIGRVFYLAPNSQQPQLLASDLAFPNGIAISPDEQTIAVAEFAAKRILSLPTATAKGGMPLAYVLAYTEGGVGPDGLLYDQTGQLYAANLGTGEVLVYAPAGKLLGALELPEQAGDLVTNVAITGDKIYVTESAKNEVWSMDYPVLDCLK